MTTIGLFPLNVVLFPGSILPLHIFEPRYRKLVAEVTEEDSMFGINLVRSARTYPVGCSAEVVNIFRRYPDGRLDIAIKGVRRYRLKSMNGDEKPYLLGSVDFFDDEADLVNEDLRQKCVELYNQLIDIIYAGSGDVLDTESAQDSPASFLIAEKAGLDNVKKQELLEMLTENERLQYLHDFITDYLPEVRNKKKIADIIRNDGYLPRSTGRAD